MTREDLTFPKKIIVLSGERGVGKTTLCGDMIRNRRGRGLRCAGILQPGRFSADGTKDGFDLIDVETKERKTAGNGPGFPDLGTALGKWTIDAEVFRWANETLGKVTETDVLIVDELGPLEFDAKTGLISAFDTLRRANYREAFVVIRPEKIAAFHEMGFDFNLVQLTPRTK